MAPPQQMPVVASDYESDNQGGYTSDYPGVLPPITRTKEDLNLSVIQKHNPDIIAVLSVAPYVTIYDFEATPEGGAWQKSNLTGTLFICQLTPGDYGEERYHALVLNRGGLDNFNAELRQTDQQGVEVNGDYVIISRNDGGENKVNGIFIYSEEGTSTAASRAANAELMVQLAQAAGRSRKAAEEAHAISPMHQDGLPLGHIQSHQPEEEPYHVTRYPPAPAPQLQSTPAPQIAPQPSNQVDLLALFRGQQPTHQPQTRNQSMPTGLPDSSHDMYGLPQNQPPRWYETPLQQRPPQDNVLNDLFRRSGLV